jgi:indolepyruvate ferredoxin oxidoreductase beta subunit
VLTFARRELSRERRQSEMEEYRLTHDPYNLVITGVGGQGNVMASKVVANILVAQGLQVTIGETFGATQRGGSVMSHLRVSHGSVWSTLIPKGRAHVIIGLEPIEALRVLEPYGNPEVLVIANTRPVHPIGVLCGDQDYPEPGQIDAWLNRFSRRHWFLPATDEAVKLGAPILANIILIGALAGTRVLPIEREEFSRAIDATMPRSRVAMNVHAFDLGWRMVT